ncbi:gephyrin [Copidosoma floridanum]|uniref:gephyrin n=1 Tax=Copidosoma floridanum TaxID=29053 RepID=UPI0006C9B349|nr:gephyrin [Copidosoma floridanum]
MSAITFGILTISDTCSQKKENDKSGPVLRQLLSNANTEIGKAFNGIVVCSDIVPDDEDTIQTMLIDWADVEELNVILTTGGTGFSCRDVTPEATKKVIHKEVPGIAHAMISESLKITPMAMLSRATCGIRGKTLIVNLPGSPKAAKECFCAIAKVLPHAVDLILGHEKSIKSTHEVVQGKHECPHKSGGASSWNPDDVAGRLRESPFPMISIEEAQKILKDSAEMLPPVQVEIWACRGRVLSETVYSTCHIPPFRASIKDGYAVIASDGKGRRKVLGGIEAGHKPDNVKIEPGTCVRINTGAPVPDEATAVVQVEDTVLTERGADGKKELEIEILVQPKEGQDIRPIGSDTQLGDPVLKEGMKVGAVEAGILAACGLAKVSVTWVPRIGVLSTGNELQNAGEPAKPGHIYDSNKITLMMMLRENGYEAVDLGIAIDEMGAMLDAITDAMGRADVIITTGSVSMGDKDMLKPILQDVFHAKIHFGRVNLKPGKPTTYATLTWRGTKKYFLCLPGNPVSAVVTANLFVFPLLNHLTKNNEKPVVVKAKVVNDYALDPRPEYARVILVWSDESEDGCPKAYSTGNQISSKLLSCKSANALLMLPARTAQKSDIKAGSIVPAMLLGFNQLAHEERY